MKTIVIVAGIVLAGATFIAVVQSDKKEGSDLHQPGDGHQHELVQPGSGLNPPHGQPGHRCDLPVGAPLNTSSPAMTVPSSGAPKTNPAHGLPYHRCDLPVGAPLG